MTKANKVSGFSRDNTDAFTDLKKEAFAKEWAKTGLLKSACAAAGITLPTGSKWRGHAEMELRIRELRAGAETYVGASKAYIINQLRMNAENAAAQGKYRESNDALIAMFKLQSGDKDLSAGSNVGVAASVGDLTPEQLAKKRAELFPNPALPAETRTFAEDEHGIFVEEKETLTSDRIVGNPDAHFEDGRWVERSLTDKYQELSEPFEGGTDEDDEAAEE